MPALEQAAPAHRVRCFEWPRTPPLALEEPIEARPARTVASPLLVVENLRAVHRSRHEVVVAADNVSFGRTFQTEPVISKSIVVPVPRAAPFAASTMRSQTPSRMRISG